MNAYSDTVCVIVKGNVPLGAENAGDLIGVTLSARKDDDLASAVKHLSHEGNELAALVVAVNQLDDLRDVDVGRQVERADGDLDGVLGEVAREGLY
mgnify:CR=1 FL=1